MSAERLRRAAEVLRERAEAAYPAPWKSFGGQVHCLGLKEPFTALRTEGGTAAYIATVHPAFGLAVVPILRAAAVTWERVYEATRTPSRGVDQPPAAHYGDPEAARRTADAHCCLEIAVADAVLGDAS